MNGPSPLALLALILSIAATAFAHPAPSGADAACREIIYPVYQREAVQPSWIFSRSTYTHDPLTGARVAQYMRTPPVEPLDDPRMITSRYRRIRTNLRGTDGSIDSTYEVQNWGNGRGGLDAEWERFHDAWKESELTGGFYNQQPGFFGGGFPSWGFGPHGFGNGFGYGPNNGLPPHQGFPPGYGQPQHGGQWPNGNGHQGGGQHGNHYNSHGNQDD